jgi:SAM-dependent methyltransferase
MPNGDTTRHYDTLLAPIYLWMAGGTEHALRHGAQDVADFLGTSGRAVDLGAGFGMHTCALAKSGWSVLAVDTSDHLLEELKRHCAGLPVEVAAADLMDFPAFMTGQADLVLCMGDTLTHLEGEDQVAVLMVKVREALRPGGRFIATFRDYRHLPHTAERFILVRSDPQRVLTCFLEEEARHVVVHDILHERHGDTWTMTVGRYRKARLSPAAVVAAAEAAGLTCRAHDGPRGMVELRAHA